MTCSRTALVTASSPRALRISAMKPAICTICGSRKPRVVSSTSLGVLNTTSGGSVTYTARSTGTQTVTLSDGRNSPVTASVVQTTSTTLTN